MPSLRRIIPGLIPPAFMVLAFVVNSMDDDDDTELLALCSSCLWRHWLGSCGGDMCAFLFDPF